jgi:probable phosphoglycerate mutase
MTFPPSSDGDPRHLGSIHLVRSARTAFSAEDRLTGRLDPPLDDEGLVQAEAVAHATADAGVTHVFTSPLLRARQTADVIALRIGVAPRIVDDLADLDVGVWAGLTMREASAASPDEFAWFFRMPQVAEIPGGERTWDAQARVIGALEEIARGAGSGSVVAVTHELPIRFVLMRLRELEGTAIWDPTIPPGWTTRLRASEEGLQIPTVLEDMFRAARRRHESPSR